MATTLKGDRIILPSSSADPGNIAAGHMYFNTTDNALKIRNADNSGWGSVIFSPRGTQQNPARSLSDLQNENWSDGNTVYVLNDDGGTAEVIYKNIAGGKIVAPWYNNSNLVRYYDFRSTAGQSGTDYKGSGDNVNGSFSSTGREIAGNSLYRILNNSFNTGYSVIAKVKWGSSGTGMVFQTANNQGDDGLTRNGNNFGNRTHGGGYSLRGNYISNLNGGDYSKAVAFGYTPRSDYANFWSSTGANLPEVEAQGGSYDSMTVNCFSIGSDYDQITSSVIVERLAIFNTNLSDSQYSQYIQQFNDMPSGF